MKEAEALTPAELEAWITNENREPAAHLVEQLKSPLGVIPFVGAGLSAPFGFPGWGRFLGEAEPAIGGKVRKRLDKGDYEGAAELIEGRIGEDAFQKKVEAAFSGQALTSAVIENEAVFWVPLLASGPVITTNFDSVLEQAFEHAGRGFGKQRILGPEPDNIVKAFHRNQHALLKIHGDCGDRGALVFTAWQYEDRYGTKKSKHPRTQLSRLAWLMFTHRPLLFLGCSLENDRTVECLADINKRLGGVVHYAVTEANPAPAALEKRKKALRRLGVSPLWFPPKRFDRIAPLLADLVERAATHPLPLPIMVVPPARAEVARESLQRERACLKRRDAQLPEGHFQRVLRALCDGRLAFFLGSGVHLGRLPLGDPFYADLARRYTPTTHPGGPPTTLERTAIAEYVADHHGRGELLRHVRQALLGGVPAPGLLHWLIADLPRILRDNRARANAPFIVTTNWDDVLEDALEAAGVPFHLFSYQARRGGGRFAHRMPDGAARIIDRPDGIRRLDTDVTIVVKLNGGIDRKGRVPENPALTRKDYIEVAAQIPDVLPWVLRQRLAGASLLFLGSGLREPDIETFARFVQGPDRAVRSWAIVPQAHDADYWRLCGIEMVQADLESYLAELHDLLQ